MKILLMLLFLTVPVHAQTEWWKMEGDKKKSDKVATTTKEPADSVESAVPTDIQGRIKTFRNNGRFSVRYDKFRDETYLSVGPFFVQGKTPRGYHRQINVSAHFVLDKEPVKFAYLRFGSHSTDWVFLRDSEFLALIDGERITFGDGERDSKITRYGVSESMIYEIPIEQFLKITRAVHAEFKVGSTELILKDEHQEAFRDLYSLINQ